MALPVASLHQQTQIPFTLARKTLDNLLVGDRQQLIHVLHPLLLPVLVLRLTPAPHAHCRPFALAAVNASPFSVESQ